MQDESLHAFFGDSLSRWNISKDSDLHFLSEVCEFIQTLKTYGLTSHQINVDDFGIFHHKGIRKTVDSFMQRNPRRPLPLEDIVIIQHVTPESYRSDMERILTNIHESREAMSRFSAEFSIKISLNIYVAGFDSGIACRICEVMDSSSIGTTTFIFSFPPITIDAATGMRSALDTFLENPVTRKAGILIANFPLCFASSSKFKALSRFSLEGLKSLVKSQRETIKEVTEQTHNFMPPCHTCRSRHFCYAFTDIENHRDYHTVVSPPREDTVAFIGGSLPKNEYIDDKAITYTSPAEQGDILAAILAGFSNILIIDGYFYSKFPCTTFEVMTALERGLNVFGSSSIGALRAVELDSYGMTGLGYVYNYLKKQEVKPYHIVAQTYKEDDTALTIPLVDIIYFLDCAVSENIITGNESARCLKVADKISFPMLSFEYFLRLLRNTGTLEAGKITRLENQLTLKGHDFFGIKKKDAYALLNNFREAISNRDSNFVQSTFYGARDRYLALLYSKYRCHADLSLPADWREFKPSIIDGAAAQRDRRELPPAQTCQLAKVFFQDMGVLLSDTTGYDPPAGSFIINTFFIPFYFLNYPLSSATGNGDIYEEALVSAYMELIERIPTHQFHINALKADELDLPPFPVSSIPQYYNLSADAELKQKIIEDHGFVKVTDILSGNNFTIPGFAVMSMFAGSDGNAAGNSLTEAILYGIYEIVERDTNQIYLNDSFCEKQRNLLRIDPNAIDDDRCHTMLGHLLEKGYKIILYYMANTFQLPCIRCQVFDTNRKIECHGSTAVRADLNSAIYAALHEAYMQHISYFAGIRDDYRAFLAHKSAQIAYRNTQETLSDTKPVFLRIDPARQSFTTVKAELNYVTERIAAGSIRHILVANTSPIDKYILKSVKVIIPGTELWFVPEYQPSQFIEERTRRTRLAIESCIGNRL